MFTTKHSDLWSFSPGVRDGSVSSSDFRFLLKLIMFKFMARYLILLQIYDGFSPPTLFVP